MIPKIIHYCWLSNEPIPQEFQKYIKGWKEKLSDYQFILWNFERFPKGKSKWVRDAFDSKKYAFAADYIRLYALYNYGGIYLDMDVEVLKSFNDFLSLNSMLCFQNDGGAHTLEVAAFGVEKKSEWIKICLDSYEKDKFIKVDTKGHFSYNELTLPVRVRDVLKKNGYDLKEVQDIKMALMVCSSKEIPIFGCEYFSPKSYVTGKMNLTSNTYSIHHFAGSWETNWVHYKSWIRHHFTFLYKLIKMKK